MCTPVTLKELDDWLHKNIHRTWNISTWKEGSPERTFQVKYLDICLDTRDMKVWRIVTRSFANVGADTHDDFEGTILELLEKRLDEWSNR